MKLKLFFIVLCMFSCISSANIGTYGFKNFPNYYFVETGTFSGDGLKKAYDSGCFKELYSIEFFQAFVQDCQRRFKNYNNIHIIHGDSKSCLWDVIKDMNKPITFWLDAHIYPPSKNTKNCPLIEELEQIKRHPIKTHTILIDDLSCCGTLAFDYLTLDDLKRKIKEINPSYTFQLLVGGDQDEVKDNILLAYVL